MKGQKVEDDVKSRMLYDGRTATSLFFQVETKWTDLLKKQDLKGQNGLFSNIAVRTANFARIFVFETCGHISCIIKGKYFYYNRPLR
jgi:hypothetical protein